MATSNRSFLTELYIEHLEEASFLYEQRLALLDDPEVAWTDVQDFEDRFEAHIDALVLGGDLALEVCHQRIDEGDFGETHALIRVACRVDRRDLLSAAIARLEPDDEAGARAVGEALEHEMPHAWLRDLPSLLPLDGPATLSIFARIVGYRRIDAAKKMLPDVDRAPEPCRGAVVWALGRLRADGARLSLNRHLTGGDESIRPAALLALLRIGDPQMATICQQQARSDTRFLVPLGLGGDPAAVRFLEPLAANPNFPADGLLALGLLGAASSVGALLRHLEDEKKGGSAALALQLITGAPLYEEAVVPEAAEEEGEEAEPAPAAAPGAGEDSSGDAEVTPAGTTVVRVSQDRASWESWLAENGKAFRAGVRYRLGKPYSPATLLECLESAASQPLVRRLAADELAIRYAMTIPFETDLWVSRQKALLEEIRRWIQASGQAFREGSWYYAGRFVA